MINRLEWNCVCGLLGRLVGTPELNSEGLQRVKFLCACPSPFPDWEFYHQQS